MSSSLDRQMEVQEALGLVDHVQEPAGQVLAVRRVQRVVGPRKPSRIDLGVRQVSLRLAAEQHDASQSRVAVLDQVPVPEEAFPVRVEGSLAGSLQEALEGVQIQVREGEPKHRRLIVEEALGGLEEPQELLP